MRIGSPITAATIDTITIIAVGSTLADVLPIIKITILIMNNTIEIKTKVINSMKYL